METKRVTIDLSKVKNLSCTCGSKLFQPLFILKKIPKLLIAQPNDLLQPLQIFVCAACNEVHPESFDLMKEPPIDRTPTKIN